MKRFALVSAIAIVVAGVVVGAASALAFDDSSDFACTTPDDSVWTCPTGFVGTPYSVQFKSRAGCTPYVKYSVASGSELPPGLSISSDGLVSGTPTQPGTWEAWIQVQDIPASEGGIEWCADDRAAQRQFIFKILPGLELQPASVPPATVSVAYSATLTATPAGTQTFTVTSGALPPGLTLGASDGVISGIPTTTGSFQFKVRVSDTEGRSIAREYTINVANPLAIASPVLEGQLGGRAEVGVPLSGELTATGGNGTFAWTVAGGSLPAGVELAPDGTISGTPTAAGSFTFTVQVADTDGRTATVNVPLKVSAKLAFKTLALKAATVGHAYGAKLKTLGGVGPLRWQILSGKLPRGIHFQKKLGAFAGVARREGTYRVRVLVTDALGVTAKKTLLLTVEA